MIPHHFLHHLTHKDQPRERGQRPHEDTGFYEEIAGVLRGAGRIVIVGHGTGHSNAACHLVEVLKTRHRDVLERLSDVVTADVSGLTNPELLDAGRRVLLEKSSAKVAAT